MGHGTMLNECREVELIMCVCVINLLFVTIYDFFCLHLIMATSFTLALTRKIASKSSNMLDTFCEMDIDGDGSISRSDLAQSLKRMFNISLTNSQLNALCVKFGFTRMNRRVNYNMFVDTVRDLATGESTLKEIRMRLPSSYNNTHSD